MLKSLKASMFSSFFETFRKPYYRLLADAEGVEKDYYHNGKLIVFVEEEIGKQIYEIVTYLADNCQTITTRRIESFSIDKYYADKQNVIKAFQARIHWQVEADKEDLQSTEYLEELTMFVQAMESMGYFLDKDKFQKETCMQVASFLSFFTKSEEKAKESKGCLIEYAHYTLTEGKSSIGPEGRSLQKFYQEIENRDEPIAVSEFPYTFLMARLCYKYYKNGELTTEDLENIYLALEGEELFQKYGERQYEGCKLVTSKDFSKTYQVVEKTDEYTIYRNTHKDKYFDIKIYRKITQEFATFLRENERWTVQQYALEQMGNLLMDFDGNIVGYTCYTKKESKTGQDIQKIFEGCESAQEILKFAVEISEYVLEVKSNLTIYNRIRDKDFSMSKVSQIANNHDYNHIQDVGQDAIQLEKALMVVRHTNANSVIESEKWYVRKISDLFDLYQIDDALLKKRIVQLFFKLYLAYLQKKNAELKSKKQFLEQKEVRYLSPILAKEFIAFGLGHTVDYEKAVKEFFGQVCYYNFDTKKDWFDLRFEYNPEEVLFLFDYEAEEKYSIKLKKGTEQQLPDGRIVEIFNRRTSITAVKAQLDKNYQLLQAYYLDDLEGEKVKLVKISEIIYSTKINDNGMYQVIGYVTTPRKGKNLASSANPLLQLDNRQLYYAMSNFFAKCRNTNYELTAISFVIPFECIWLDDDLTFYINLLDKAFTVREEHDYLNSIINSCGIQKAFQGIDWSQYTSEDWLKLAESCDAYCEEHKLYYSSKKRLCPICEETKIVLPRNFWKRYEKIFEDEVGMHYRLSAKYNLKLYKEEYRSLKQLEQNIDWIVGTLSEEEAKVWTGQDCFIPLKKAIDEEGKFVGYIYSPFSFEQEASGIDTGVDLKDLTRLNNLARIKGLLRLTYQVKYLRERGFDFIKNPFGYVFISKNHKKQVQILNIDFICGQKQHGKERLTERIYEYVNEVLAADDTIQIDAPICRKDLVFDKLEFSEIIDALEQEAEKLTKYCTVHRMYYRKEELFCPKCMGHVDLEELSTEIVDKAAVTKAKKIGEGGESFIYSYQDEFVAKVFKTEVVDINFKVSVLTKMMKKRAVLEEIDRRNSNFQFVFPQKLLVDKTGYTVFAYVMKKVSGMPLSNLRDKIEIAKLGFTLKDVLEVLIHVGEGIEALHQQNIYIGDLNGRNILFDSEKVVYFLEFDGMGIDEIKPLFCTDGYIDPASKNNITMEDDWYSFAIQAFHYLTYTHPFNGIYYDEVEGKRVKLDIVAKMERRISLLGNHGMKAPAIAQPWDWMDTALQEAFLNIFEGTNRESILPYLYREYQKLGGIVERKDLATPAETNRCTTQKAEPEKVEESKEKGIIHINSKFVATKVNPFETDDVVRVINQYAAICKKGNQEYARIVIEGDGKKECYDARIIQGIGEITDVLVLRQEKIAWFVYEKIEYYANFNLYTGQAGLNPVNQKQEFSMVAVNLVTGEPIHHERIDGLTHATVNGNTLYCTGIWKGKYRIFQMTVTLNDVDFKTIAFLPEQKTKAFLAKFNSKFVLVKESQNGKDEVYCNNQKLCDISYLHENRKYNILYDDVSHSWLVISSEGEGIMIKANGNYQRVSIPHKMQVESIGYRKQSIYIPLQEALGIIQVKNDQIISKTMECHVVMKPESRIYDINPSGFNVITDNTLYEIRKG